MAECATLLSNFKLHLQRSDPNGLWLKSQKLYSKKFSRSASLPLRRVSRHNPISVSNGSRSNCLGSMVQFESAAASDWVLVMDQVLLTASVFLAYMAGVIPSRGSYINSQKNNSKDPLLPESPIFFGSSTEKEDRFSCQCIWDAVKGKITKTLLAIENGVILEENFVAMELSHTRHSLSLYAVANGPRFRLLLSSTEQLEKEVNKIPNISTAMEREEWIGIFSSTIKKTCQAALLSWMEKEFCTENCKPDKELLFSMSEKLSGDDIILGNFRKQGKMDLFADLIGFFRYGDFRDFSYYDHNIYSLHGSAILEDLIINLADAISSVYLEVISVDSETSEKISNYSLSLCTLSARALQKLRNEVAMREWIHQNFGEIVLMYEDRFDLRVLKLEPYPEAAEKLKESYNWWTRLTLRKCVTVQPSPLYSIVSPFPLTLKRTKELRALQGWKYYFSLIIELSDIAVPMVKAIVSQVRTAISFFLVSLIGRSVGLVYTGIRQSLRWK
ncbi:uncharacterized protein LOC130812930 [Amaranthus tricolor]|uniref:uncharacterized protein LOC130812930 n=1 Tax=Amaranthus tricolor TaxID=29722 RepID=UPI00258884B1|nr:uncharacterized protein LOC130812930 [Amaranthus tricolor]XP_057534563.1 uncharacterized protein LOC130812930 [Amaranthus tricolor]